MNIRIDTVTARAKLLPRRDPYWHRIAVGTFLGFRKMNSDSIGTWFVRHRDVKGQQLRHSLGSLDGFLASERFDKASAMARDWVNHLACGGSKKAVTVIDACDAYVRKIREQKGEQAAADLARRYQNWIWPSPLCAIELTKLSRNDLAEFRSDMIATPAWAGTKAAKYPRSKSTVNRDVAAVRAALNSALDDGAATSDFAWRKPLLAFKNVSKRRELYLDRDQRRELIRCAAPDLANFVQALCVLPLRPGALAALRVDDFDSRLNTLRVGKDKSGADRKLVMPAEITSFFSLSFPGALPMRRSWLALMGTRGIKMDGKLFSRKRWWQPACRSKPLLIHCDTPLSRI